MVVRSKSSLFVAAIWVPGEDPSDARSTKLLEISGLAHHVELAEHIYSFLLKTIDTLWQDARREYGYNGRAQKRRFSLGLLQGFSERSTSISGTTELVRRHDAKLKGFVKRRHPRLRSGRGTTVICDDAFVQGKQRGKTLSIRPPLKQSDDSSKGKTLSLPWFK